MHPATEKLIASLRGLEFAPTACDYAQRGYHYELEVPAEKLRSLAECLLKEEMFLVFVGGLDAKPAPLVLYQFASYERPCRLLIRVEVKDNAVPTISDIFQGANWHERETRDFYGINFAGHPYLKPLILAEEDVDLKPLLKKDADLKDRSELCWTDEQPATEPEKAPEKAPKKAAEESGKADE